MDYRENIWKSFTKIKKYLYKHISLKELDLLFMVLVTYSNSNLVSQVDWLRMELAPAKDLLKRPPDSSRNAFCREIRCDLNV